MAISVISRHGKVAYTQATGYSDAEGKVPIKDDDIFRLYSMTKPPVAVGLLMLYDEGRFQLDDPVWYFLGPKWKRENVRVFEAWTDRKATEYTTVAADREITMRHVLTHTAGLSHGFDGTGVGIPVDRIYAKEWQRRNFPAQNLLDQSRAGMSRVSFDSSRCACSEHNRARGHHLGSRGRREYTTVCGFL